MIDLLNLGWGRGQELVHELICECACTVGTSTVHVEISISGGRGETDKSQGSEMDRWMAL